MTSASVVILVGGALEARTAWDGLVPLLDEHATVLVPARPGLDRGDPGRPDGPGTDPAHLDRPDPARARELDALCALLERMPGAVLVGHSSGAVLALRAAAAAGNVAGVVAYEPPPAPPRPGVADHLRVLVDAGERSRAVLTFLTDAVGLPEAMARPPADDPVAAAGAHTLAADVEIVEIGLPAGTAARVTAPVVLLLGTASPPSMTASVTAFAERLPAATVRTLDGQGHDAHRTAPHLVADAVLDLLGRP